MQFTLLFIVLFPTLVVIGPLLALVLIYIGGLPLLLETVRLLVGLFLEDFLSLKTRIYPSRKDLAGSIVLVTGGGGCLGRLMCLEFAKKNCIVVIWDVRGAEAVAEEIKNLGKRAFAYTCDLGDRNNIYENAARVKKEVGDVDILVNNAGIVTGKPFLESSDEMIEATMKVNTLAHFWTLKAFLPAMLEKKSGHVVTIASSAGLTGVPGLVDYCASKYAAVGIDESLRHELYKQKLHNVRTTVVCPFFINTGMFEGVTTRFPLLLPILEPPYVVNRIINAIETDQAVICLPLMIWSLSYLRAIFSAPSTALLTQYLGVWDSMDKFKGHAVK